MLGGLVFKVFGMTHGYDVLVHLQPGRFQMRLPTTSLGIQPLMFSACTALSDWRWPMELFPTGEGHLSRVENRVSRRY